MMDEIEEIINKLDNVTPEEWNKREDETEEEFEERIQEIEEDIEDELIDAISDNLLNEQEINEEEAVKEAREKIDKEYKLYEDAFEKDDNGKLALKDSEELAKLGYESKEEIEKLNTIMNNYNNPDQYIEDIRNSIKAKKDIDAEIERKVEIAKTYISAKIRGEEPVIPSNEEKIKKYEDNNNYITTTRYLKHVPAVQNEYIYTNRIISQNYIPYVPSNRKVVTSGVGTATQIVSRPVVRPKTSVSNPTKVKVLRNLETKMDKTNDLTKQKIQARTELKRVFKEFQDKDLTEDEVTDLQDKIAKIEKKYPNIVNEKTLSKLYDSFNVKLPEKTIVTERSVEQAKEKLEGEFSELEQKIDSELKKIGKTRQSEKKEPKTILNIESEPKVEQISTPTPKPKIRQTKRTLDVKSGILGIGGVIAGLRLKGHEKLDEIVQQQAERKNRTPEDKEKLSQEVEQVTEEVKQDLAEQEQVVKKLVQEVQTEEVQKSSDSKKEEQKEVVKFEKKSEKKKDGFIQRLMQSKNQSQSETTPKTSKKSSSIPLEKQPNADILLKVFKLGQNKNFDIEDFNLRDFGIATKYLEENDDPKNLKAYYNLVERINEFTGDKFISKLSEVDGYFDIMILEKMYKLYSEGIKSQDGTTDIIEKNPGKAREYLSKEFSYLSYLKRQSESKVDNAVENIKNEARFCKALNIARYTSIAKKIDGINLMIESEKLRRSNNNVRRESCRELITQYEEKIRNNQDVGLYVLETLGDIYYQGIVAKNGNVIMETDKIKARSVYEKMVKEYPNANNDIAYNRLLNLYSDNTLPIYDKKKAKKIERMMRQNGIKEEKEHSEKKKRTKETGCTYVCSDLHGEYEAYKTIIDRIGDNDKLYILGDVIDRGPDGIKILQDIMMKQEERGQIEFLMGNHEYMMLQAIQGNKEQKELWSYNDKETHDRYEELSHDEQYKIKDFLLESLIYKQVREGRQDYYLVHARAVQDSNKESQTYREMESKGHKAELQAAVFDRAEYDCKEEDIAKKGMFTIIGHSPTFESIELGKGYVDIDCGISYGDNVALVNLTNGDVEYYNAEEIREKDKEKENEKTTNQNEK